MQEAENLYWWVRVFDYSYERDGWQHKGTMLDEFYLKGVTRDEAKKEIIARYGERTASKLRFAKPKQTDGMYVVLMDSSKFYYDRFYATIDTHCFWCLSAIAGKASEFPRGYIGDKAWPSSDETFTDPDTVYFCNYDHKAAFSRVEKPVHGEGEFQVKEAGDSGNVFGYIYLIYNRAENLYYIGQTRFKPFFRWQEHVNSGEKGDMEDLSFSVLATVRREHNLSDEGNQKYLNSVEAWWISKYKHEGHSVRNVATPRITVESLKQRFNDMIAKKPEQVQMEFAAPLEMAHG